MLYSVGTFKLMNAKALTQNTTNYTDSITFERSIGDVGVLITSSAVTLTLISKEIR